MIAPSSGNVTELFACNHEETDSHVNFHASFQRLANVVIFAYNCEILFSGMHACSIDKSRRWFYSYEGSTFADHAKIAKLRYYIVFSYVSFPHQV